MRKNDLIKMLHEIPGNPDVVIWNSKEWCKHFDCVVFDPDGWDRKNYEYSFNEEMIPETEFRKRVKRSSMLMIGTLDNS